MLSNIFKHLHLVCRHKWNVFKLCCRAGIPLQGLLHDLSKFSPTEFWESVKYYNGKRSPLAVSREVNGYSKAWLHHKGRNKHHWEYWIDGYNQGGYGCIMPFKYACEMICDMIAATKVYNTTLTLKEGYRKLQTYAKNPRLSEHSLGFSISIINDIQIINTSSALPPYLMPPKEGLNHFFRNVRKLL